MPPGVGLSGAVHLHQPFLACLSCGHLWSKIAPAAVRQSIRTHGTELAKQVVEYLDSGPMHDLPDMPEAREAGQAVAEIDTLVWSGKTPEATRQYRELTHCTWDQAIDSVRHWVDLTRPQKLALFGWVVKDQKPTDEKGVGEHPMRDRLLDG